MNKNSKIVWNENGTERRVCEKKEEEKNLILSRGRGVGVRLILARSEVRLPLYSVTIATSL